MMSRDTASSERDAELAQLRAEVAELRAMVAVLLAPPPARPGEVVTPDGQRANGRSLPRRGILAGVAALVAGALANGTTRPAEATHGVADATGALHLNQTNPSNDWTIINHNPVANRPALVVNSTTDGIRVTSTASINSGYALAAETGASSRAAIRADGTGSDTLGVVAFSTNGHGVFGQTRAAAGTVVNGMLAAGLTGRTSSTVALYGYADGPANPSYAPVGGVGQCESGFGLWGLSSAGPGATTRPGGGALTAASGVLGTSTNNVGVYAISSGTYALAADGNGPSTVAVLARAQGGRAGVFFGNVEINGHLTVTGGVNGPVGQSPPTASGDSRGTTPSLQAMQSPEALVEGIGRGQLGGGRAEVRFDAAVVSLLPDDQYDVFLTEYGDHNALYVAERTRQGFTVRAKDSPTASGAFSYRVVARSRTVRATADAAPLHQPTIPVPQGVPTLPVGRETPPIAPALKPEAR
jgi:hypothetical protein